MCIAELRAPRLALSRNCNLEKTGKAGSLQEAQKKKEGNSMPQKLKEHHTQAAEHHEHAAKHHRKAAEHHAAGKHEVAAHHAHAAHGHHLHATHHASEAAKRHVELHGHK